MWDNICQKYNLSIVILGKGEIGVFGPSSKFYLFISIGRFKKIVKNFRYVCYLTDVEKSF